MENSKGEKVSRKTQQKEQLVSVLEADRSFRSAQEIFARLRTDGIQIGLTTVYSQLKALEAQGAVEVSRSINGEATYRKCQVGSHHHHIVCRDCGVSVEFTVDSFEAAANQIAKENGFTMLSHTVEVFGLCANCSQEPPKDS
ncbi:MAG: Fur family transcriptional regulator [Actinomycetota bacterium]|nr:Fur family transcriptional regulator [Actinomycetota bacterium]